MLIFVVIDFNKIITINILILFQDAAVLKNKLLYAIESGAGFELSWEYIVVICEKNVRRKRVSTEQGEICIVKS